MLDAIKAYAFVMMAGMEVALNAHTTARMSHSGRLIIAKRSPAKKLIVIINNFYSGFRVLFCVCVGKLHNFH